MEDDEAVRPGERKAKRGKAVGSSMSKRAVAAERDDEKEVRER